jgi:hypothetical protein
MKKELFRLKFRIYIQLTLVYFAIALVGILIFEFLIPEEYFPFYPFIGLFYWIIGMAMNYLLDRTRLESPKRLLNIFLMARMIKFLLTIVFLFVGTYIVGEDAKMAFAISLMCNYFIYTGLEMYVYYAYNKRISRGANRK